MTAIRSGAASRDGRSPYPELAYYSRVRPRPAANDNVRPTGWAWRLAGAVLGAAVAGGVAMAHVIAAGQAGGRR